MQTEKNEATVTVLATPQTERAVIVDIVRGFALIGVLIVNFTAYTDQNLPSTLLNSLSTPLDNVLSQLRSIFIEWKFMTIFSILFGYGFGLLLASLEKKNINATAFFLRRMFWLFLIGTLHTLFWWGDVLHFYAVCGVLLLAFRKASNKIILLCAITSMFILPPVISYCFRHQPDFFTDPNLQFLSDQYKYGILWDVFAANIKLYYQAFIITGLDFHDIVETLGRFLFGYFLVRIKWFDSIATKTMLYKKVSTITAPVMIAYFILRWLTLQETISIDDTIREFIFKIGIVATSIFYCTVLTLLYVYFSQARIFVWLQALGRMTLTNYLLISVISVLLFYGIGFGLLGEFNMTIIWLLTIGWLVIEILFSIRWLASYRFGPLEWIWRQLTYQRRISLKK